MDNLLPSVALNGVRIDGPAPADAILAAHTIAPFDDCGGHINLGVGYYYHAVNSRSKEVSAAVADHAPIIGIAMDGHILHGQLDADGVESSDLDA
ncbi:YHYH protein [uncultured Roseobacter sp.]|uniref:YHYH protein n=1 Tax=uncultured Roseobacter sp. TaxID=114847 RepID=UPI002613D017|nr:YHYH protein [uncultured Roseobacter sp.]